jgi:hypothetical protein
MFNTSVAVPVVANIRRHIGSRTLAVERWVGEHARPDLADFRTSVKSDVTVPNTSGWEPRNSMSEHASPPGPRISIAW